jgi:hypothetical protein
MYSINNIAFSNFGIIPGRIYGSNIAVSGMLDMPERIGKSFHDWTGDAGIEPYVLQPEIRHGGRSINFASYVVGADKASAYTALNLFYKELDSYQDLVSLVTPYGTHQVYIKEKTEAISLQQGWVGLEIQFEEPIPPAPEGGVLVGVEVAKPHIDGVSFESLGMFFTAFKGHLNKPKIKDQDFTAYQTAGFQITPAEALEFEVELIAYAPSFALLKANIQALENLLRAPGLRNINMDGSLREVFNTQGFRVSRLKLASNYAICKLNLPLMMAKAGEPIIISDLTDNTDNELVNNLLEKLNIS